ncbi:putative alcohol dehydrogenase [Mollisia scopiformis]|uniref:Putative alcohol dehydrogenase n=1 Tax=Mollisia scopiformis TaxID=149040 RepID=A0A194X304_MOLSC|nr:putative alcohol dehydrogenase [Mollisia scopiformis]KUJ14570.1 putative alcohol dehydrogenase [Mollisia scopiformis]
MLSNIEGGLDYKTLVLPTAVDPILYVTHRTYRRKNPIPEFFKHWNSRTYLNRASIHRPISPTFTFACLHGLSTIMAPKNRAAYLEAKMSPKLVVRSAPYTSAKAGQIVIKNHALAINPLEWLIQERGNIMFGWLKYPFVLGADNAGEVVEVGPGVTRFKIGDRVLGHCAGTSEPINDSAQGGFQEYTVLLEHMSTPIPESISYERACVLPLGLSTAVCGLFQTDQLSLPLPTSPARKPTGKTLLIWGGSTSVGVNAIQLAISAGYEVITTCSPRNYELVKSLGACGAFDYNSPTVVADIVRAFNSANRISGGAMSIGQGAATKCIDVLSQVQGDKFLSMASYPVPQVLPKHFGAAYTIWTFLTGMVEIWFKSKMNGVKFGTIIASTLIDNGVGKKIYEGYLEKALEMGDLKPFPEPLVVGKGLEFVQEAMDRQKKGVSAKKVVVLL